MCRLQNMIKLQCPDYKIDQNWGGTIKYLGITLFSRDCASPSDFCLVCGTLKQFFCSPLPSVAIERFTEPFFTPAYNISPRRGYFFSRN